MATAPDKAECDVLGEIFVLKDMTAAGMDCVQEKMGTVRSRRIDKRRAQCLTTG